MSEKYDIHSQERKYNSALEKLKADSTSISSDNKELILNFLRDGALGKTILRGKKKTLDSSTLNKYLMDLKDLSYWFKQLGIDSFNNIDMKAMEDFIIALDTDKFKKQNNDKFQPATKVRIKKSIKKFWKWKDGKCKVYPELVEWIDTSLELKDPKSISKEEADKMILHATSIRDKCIIGILFDGGLRIEELLNSRKEDLTKAQDTWKIRIQHSKTKQRTISLPLYTQIIDAYIESISNLPQDAFLYPSQKTYTIPLSYSSSRWMLQTIGKRSIKKSVSPHCLRHSSVTFYCNRLTQAQLCYRFGWDLSSPMPSLYIDRSGIMDGETVNIVRREKNLELEDKYNDLLILVKGLMDQMNSMKVDQDQWQHIPPSASFTLGNIKEMLQKNDIVIKKVK